MICVAIGGPWHGKPIRSFGLTMQCLDTDAIERGGALSVYSPPHEFVPLPTLTYDIRHYRTGTYLVLEGLSDREAAALIDKLEP